MSATTRLIQVGTGGYGEKWCRQFLPQFADDPRLEVVAAVDRSPEALIHAQEGLGLAPERCFTNLDSAIAKYQADALSVVVPPASHEAVVDVALVHGLDILCAKPISDSLESSVRIAQKVKTAGVRMGVTMGHRFDKDKTTLRNEIRSVRNGRLDYLVFRFTASARTFGSWGQFRHQMPDPMLIEGSVHHLDIIADIARSPCRTISANTWKPSWAQYEGDTNVLLTMEFENGVRAQYEAATAAAAALSNWGQEYIRAECEFATLVLDRRVVTRFPFDAVADTTDLVDINSGQTVNAPSRAYWTHARLLDDFLSWRSGGPPMETEVAKNLMSMVLVSAAIESARCGETVVIREFLADRFNRT